MKLVKNLEKALWVTASQVAEKLKFLSFRGTLRAEESLILLTLEPREIPHFVRNDKMAYFSRGLSRRESVRPKYSRNPRIARGEIRGLRNSCYCFSQNEFWMRFYCDLQR